MNSAFDLYLSIKRRPRDDKTKNTIVHLGIKTNCS
jgi:hypothetical protein